MFQFGDEHIHNCSLREVSESLLPANIMQLNSSAKAREAIVFPFPLVEKCRSQVLKTWIYRSV